jgi:hypothetical protein
MLAFIALGRDDFKSDIMLRLDVAEKRSPVALLQVMPVYNASIGRERDGPGLSDFC